MTETRMGFQLPLLSMRAKTSWFVLAPRTPSMVSRIASPCAAQWPSLATIWRSATSWMRTVLTSKLPSLVMSMPCAAQWWSRVTIGRCLMFECRIHGPEQELTWCPSGPTQRPTCASFEARSSARRDLRTFVVVVNDRNLGNPSMP